MMKKEGNFQGKREKKRKKDLELGGWAKNFDGGGKFNRTRKLSQLGPDVDATLLKLMSNTLAD